MYEQHPGDFLGDVFVGAIAFNVTVGTVVGAILGSTLERPIGRSMFLGMIAGPVGWILIGFLEYDGYLGRCPECKGGLRHLDATRCMHCGIAVQGIATTQSAWGKWGHFEVRTPPGLLTPAPPVFTDAPPVPPPIANVSQPQAFEEPVFAAAPPAADEVLDWLGPPAKQAAAVRGGTRGGAS